MLETIIMGILAVIAAFLNRLTKSDWPFIASLTIIFLFLSLRYDFGNDYFNYQYSFDAYTRGEGDLYFKGTEYGWYYLNNIFSWFGPNGFYLMVAFLAMLTVISLYRLCKEYIPAEYTWLFIFIYVFSPYCMLVMSSAMRQQAALSIFIYSIIFLTRGQYIRYILGVIIASLFHTSALVLLLLVGAKFTLHLSNKINTVIVVMLVVITFYIPEKIVGYLEIIPFLDIYSHYGEMVSEDSSIGLGVLIQVAITSWILITTFRKLSVRKNIFVVTNIASLILIPLSLYSPLITRIGFYLLPIAPVAYVYALESTSKKVINIIFLTLIVSLTIYEFYIFFESTVWRSYFMEYRTVLSVL